MTNGDGVTFYRPVSCYPTLALLLAATCSTGCTHLCTVSANCALWKSAASRRISSQSAAIVQTFSEVKQPVSASMNKSLATSIS